jgi:Holliday junction resolvasome RuvABC endonuclease subunit
MRFYGDLEDIRCLPPRGYIGVDPGRSSGGVAYIAEGQGWCRKVSDLTDHELWQIFSTLGALEPTHAVLEKVSAMPGQGVSSTFKFGASFGELKMALTAIYVPYTLVTPAKWQKSLGCMSRGDKNVTKTRAQQLYPTAKVTHATADALLMATYAKNLND